MLNFPNNPVVDQLYQSGSSATYKYNGRWWEISYPTQTGLTVATASYSERVVQIQPTAPTTRTGSLWYDGDNGNMYINYNGAWVPGVSSITNATSASFATTAQNLVGNAPAWVHGTKTIPQTITSGSATIVTNWYNYQDESEGQWNNATGVFTASRPGLYQVSCNIVFANVTPSSAGRTFRLLIRKNSSLSLGVSQWKAQSIAFEFDIFTGFATAVIPLNTGETFAFWVFHDSSPNAVVNNMVNYFSIMEVGGRIQR